MKPIVRKGYRKLYDEPAKNRVAEALLRYPDKEFSLSDLAKMAKVAKANIGACLDELYKLDFIKIEKLSSIWRIKANPTNWFYIRSKIVYNLNFVYQSGLVEFLVDYFKNPKTIILFGSFRKGEDISSSDIDIAVESYTPEGYNVTGLKELTEFEQMIERKIQLHIFNRAKVDKNVFNNVANGIVLWGFLEVNK